MCGVCVCVDMRAIRVQRIQKILTVCKKVQKQDPKNWYMVRSTTIHNALAEEMLSQKTARDYAEIIKSLMDKK